MQKHISYFMSESCYITSVFINYISAEKSMLKEFNALVTLHPNKTAFFNPLSKMQETWDQKHVTTPVLLSLEPVRTKLHHHRGGKMEVHVEESKGSTRLQPSLSWKVLMLNEKRWRFMTSQRRSESEMGFFFSECVISICPRRALQEVACS